MLDGRVELAALLSFRPGEFAEEVFVDAAEGVVVDGGRDFGDALEEFFQQRAGEDFVGLGQHPGELRIVLLDVTHRLIDRLAGIASFWKMQELVEARIRCEIEHPFGMVGSRFVHAGTAPRRGCIFSKPLADLAKRISAKRRKMRPRTELEYCAEVSPLLARSWSAACPETIFKRIGFRSFSDGATQEHMLSKGCGQWSQEYPFATGKSPHSKGLVRG